MLTLPKTEVLIPFHLKVSFLALSIVSSQFTSRFLRSGLSLMPRSLKDSLLFSLSKGCLMVEGVFLLDQT